MDKLRNDKTQRYFVIGVLFIVIGIISMVRHLGVFIPGWLWSWHSLVLAIGLLIGYRKNFKAGGWMLLVILGGLFTLQSILMGSLAPYSLALVFIGLGLYLLLKPTTSAHKCDFWEHKHKVE